MGPEGTTLRARSGTSAVVLRLGAVPGFGGAAAVVAAIIAYFAARHQAKTNRVAQRKEQWWKRAEWALKLTLSDDRELRIVGFETLQSLAESEWAGEHEADVVAAASDRALYAPRGPPGATQPQRRQWFRPRGGRA